MISFVNAKINLGLNIVRRRSDGYHDLETVFYPIGSYNGTPGNPEPFDDIIEIHLHPSRTEDEFNFMGNEVNCCPEDNLVCKAVKIFREELAASGNILPSVALSLDKHIPDGAGLGGGSADASFVLSALNRLAGFPFSTEKMIKIAASLGADCPFFILNRPVFAQGIGERMTPLDFNLSGYWCVVIKPDIYISTKAAFAGIKPKVPEVSIAEIVSTPPERWREKGLENDFEKTIFPQFPEIRDIKNDLYVFGALYASLSGSGSSVFGIFSSKETAGAAIEAFSEYKNVSIKRFLCKL